MSETLFDERQKPMSAVAKAKTPQEMADEFHAPVPDGGSDMMTAIARAAADPNVNVEKFERLMALKERSDAKEAEREFNIAMNEVQELIRPIAADASNPQTKSKYASYLALDKALRPIYTAHGFSLSFDTDAAGPDMVRVLCYVSHRAGHSRTYKVDMPSDGKGARGGDVMSKTHATGAAMTYGQRYLLKMIFNIAVGEDDDGNSNGGGEKITQAQAERIQEMLTRDGADLELFIGYIAKTLKAPITCIAEIPASQFKKVLEIINTRSQKAKEKAKA